MKKVSIIIPVFNRELVITETINSIRNQTYENWEVLAVDDGSTDNSRSVLKDWSIKDSRIKSIFREEYSSIKGAPTCRNIGLEEASGDYVIFLDSDDLFIPECLSNRIENYKQNPKLDFMVFQGAFFSEKIEDSNILWNKFTAEDDLIRFLRGDIVWQTTGPIWKRDFLINYNLRWEEEVASSQDWEFHINVLLNDCNFLKEESAPDYFVRRDQKDKARISEGHYSYKKYMNRIPLIEKLIYKLKEESHFLALHKYLVRDTLSCLKNSVDYKIVEEFKNLNKLFPKTIKKEWDIVISIMYYALKNKLNILYRICNKSIDVLYPGYYKGFKLNYRSKYKDIFN
ncbi:glycosyltransferase (GT2) [Formosa agariphila KMM 3901]|uniref:Glycosyltransferase (GT2) n=1 Tax=Formosa agariphila (strain DSM 15362 / KCTC 12365 / LMG 23005 / KMM 3901 / M-2Alg 35-1) TaxID=1347342 RepID=T2KP54_FORAG|nr:glycosyltransferase family 2 protein [Formosa agariphila]CDF80637.1 glycosyltransferase (GT2) [Formosa agariphila KMM 3901]